MGLFTFDKLRVGRLVKSQVGIWKSASQLVAEAKEAPLNKKFDAFLSHSSLDHEVVVAIRDKLGDFGLSVYIDWLDDPGLERNRVTHATAKRLRERMKQSKCLIYAFSESAKHSKWMPWELGYFDGMKGRAAILPIVLEDHGDSYTGVEYLGLYPYVTDGPNTEGVNRLWTGHSKKFYVEFGAWLRGKGPSFHAKPRS